MDSYPDARNERPARLDRWLVAACMFAGIIAYAAAINSSRLSGHGAVLLNDIAWSIASLGAAMSCAFAARSVVGRERQSWQLITVGCCLWFAGQCVWNYYELVLGRLPVFPHWIQLLYLPYPILLAIGLLRLPKPPGDSGITVRRAGNLGLAVCTLAVILAIAVTEPAAQSGRSLLSIAATLSHVMLYAGASVTAVYLLWSYQWQAAYWPLALIAVGSGIHTAAFIADVHNRLAGTYQATSGLSNIAWFISFASLACAGYEFAWSSKHRRPKPAAVLLARERLLEASMPALLVGAMVAMTVVNSEWITARVIYLVCGAGLLFAITLGMREAWIQREEQRLVAALNQSRDQLLATNKELVASEQRFRSLNAQLEQRVSERTAELQSAYRELESFSYAVAHDIKAPLRAINAFGSLLIDEHGETLAANARGYVERMRVGALHMSQLVDDLLAYARIERLELQAQPTDIAALIDTCIAEQRDEVVKLGAQISADIASVTLHADAAALKQTLRNLLQNALKFSARAAPPRVDIEANIVDDRLQIRVADNGIGFDMQYHDKIFALFQRLHRADQFSGTGIGLAIARKAIERMGGRLWAQSSPNQGATFYIELPLDTQ